MSEEFFRLWLSTLHTLGSRKQNMLLAQFGSARSVFEAPERLLKVTEGLTAHNIAIITEDRSLSRVDALMREMESKRIVFLSRENENFPSLLYEIPDPPVGIFYIGELPDDSWHKVGVIGSRRCSEYGLSAARLLSKPLANYPVVVVSGMARGIDSMAHRGVIDGGGKTIAVLGCGVDICYPSENRVLYNDIITNGCVLSEYPPNVKPLPAYFPARNRIISGLCNVLVVVEAAKKSGTLITVDQAHDQGREVMAVPGTIISKLSEGTNQLIKDGAVPVTGYEDILAMLRLSTYAEPPEKLLKADDKLAPEEKLVYDSLTFEPVTFDELIAKTNSQAHTIQYLCTMLELKGFIKKLPGLRYIRNI